MSISPDYLALIAAKKVEAQALGFEPGPINGALKDHQMHCADFAIRQGRAALFLDTGMGKTATALEWASQVVAKTNRPVLMLAPLACAKQHQGEAEARGYDALSIREPAEITGARTYITNYDRLEKFDAGAFAGVILDESSILKSFTGQTTRKLISTFERHPYRLACTATPAPNDHMELGQHSEFLGAMDSSEMLSRWFIADQTNMGRYRLKKPAVGPFWDWVASWARCMSKPSDIGLSDEGYILPELTMHRHMVRADRSQGTGEHLFRIPDTSATSIHKEKRLTIEARAALVAGVVEAEPNEPWLIWCDTDYEADAITRALPQALEVRGSQSAEVKEERISAFLSGEARVLLSKPSICGWGLNFQHCARIAFAGLSFSYESYYQAVRRCWRFGQRRPVHVHVAMADTERAIWDVVSRKQGDHDAMKIEMALAMKRAARSSRVLEDYAPAQPIQLPSFLRSS